MNKAKRKLGAVRRIIRTPTDISLNPAAVVSEEALKQPSNTSGIHSNKMVPKTATTAAMPRAERMAFLTRFSVFAAVIEGDNGKYGVCESVAEHEDKIL